MSFKGNKGEWSEAYAFLKILDTRVLFGADENLNQLNDIFYPVLKVIRDETKGRKFYELMENEKIQLTEEGSKTKIIELKNLKKRVAEIFEEIRNAKTTTFEIAKADALLEELELVGLNAGNSRKEDLILKIHDKYTGQEPEVGFSIKSMVGGSATLLNASSATNFIFEIKGITDQDLQEINAIDTKSSVRDRVKAIWKKDAHFEFVGVHSATFLKNLRKVDTAFPVVLANILLAYYGERAKYLPNLVLYLTERADNTLPTEMDPETYEQKVKDFLQYIALGMVPNTLWNGEMRAHGGYIIVKEDGELATYQAYDADKFRTYLYNHTKLDTPSTTRHEFGSMYKENDKYYLRLNLQIRFIG